VDKLVKLGLGFPVVPLPAILTRAVNAEVGMPALLEQFIGDAEQPYCAYGFTTSRSRDGSTALLGDYRGSL
jgi:hypothetical protein